MRYESRIKAIQRAYNRVIYLLVLQISDFIIRQYLLVGTTFSLMITIETPCPKNMFAGFVCNIELINTCATVVTNDACW